MSEQDKEFDNWYKEKYYRYDVYPKYAQFRKEMKEAWQAATAEANKRIDALEGEVAKFGERRQLYKDKWIVYKPLDAPYAGIRTEDGATIAGTSSGLSEKDAQEICANRVDADSLYAMVGMLANERKKSTQLQANNHDLREALTSIAVYNGGLQDSFSQIIEDIVNKALKATPAESLQAHDAETIKRYADDLDNNHWVFIPHDLRKPLKEGK